MGSGERAGKQVSFKFVCRLSSGVSGVVSCDSRAEKSSAAAPHSKVSACPAVASCEAGSYPRNPRLDFFNRAFLRKVFEKRDRRAKGPRADRDLNCQRSESFL